MKSVMGRNVRIGLVMLAMTVVATVIIAARSDREGDGAVMESAGTYETAMPDRMRAFADELDLAALSTIAVYTDGRIKSMGSHAASTIQDISGSHRINDRDAVFNFLDFMLRSQEFSGADVIFCKQKIIRARIADEAAKALDAQLTEATRLAGASQLRTPNRQIIAQLAAFDTRLTLMNRLGATTTARLVRVAVPGEQRNVRDDVTLDEVRNVLIAAPPNELGVSPDELDAILEVLTLAESSSPGALAADIRRRFDDRMAKFVETGLISVDLIQTEPVLDLLAELNEDVIRTSRFVNQINFAIGTTRPNELFLSLRIVAPADGGLDDPWLNIRDLNERLAADRQKEASLAARMHAHESTSLNAANEIEADLAVLRDQIRWHEQILSQWSNIIDGWQFRNAEMVNTATVRLAAVLRGVNPEIYPSAQKLGLETIYFKMKNLTWIWVIYALGLAPLLMSVIFRWGGARWLGMSVFTFAFLMHTAAILLRWYVSGRWPNSNMFEAVTTAAWMGGCLAVLLELTLGRTPMRGFFALASSVASMTAMMAAHYLPLQLNPNISNMMPVLHDLWLYIHTNVIIFGYCLVFMAAVSAFIYLLHRGVKKLTGKSGVSDYARVGGAGSLIMTSASGEPYINRMKSSFGQVLDGATMILLELAFVMLWAGIVMGAVWADHSWGRPWGWDPKEVFALNTFIIFVVLIHVRMKAKDKGMWTAILAVVGAGVMLFNWTAINFVITGLHSYA